MGTIYTSTRAQWGLRNVHRRALQPLACYVKHSEQLLRTAQRAVRQCARAAEQSAVAPFRGCGPKKQSISLLPTARRSFSFIDSCPPIRSMVKPKPSSEFTNVTIVESSIPSAAKYDRLKESCIKKRKCMTEYSCLAIIQQQLCWSHLGVKSQVATARTLMGCFWAQFVSPGQLCPCKPK